MASRLASFQSSAALSSSLLKHPPEAIPSIDELERLQSELQQAKQKAIDRARKAEEDLRTIEESMRRISEREKGKSKAVDRVKKEHECQYMFLVQFIPILTVFNCI